ncbi:predicted protein [Chaetoceros tenuissimus]|uniref:Uncharacterized protein n=1 Tax=Chaetoceros tenuissimus TaxID=426638 RepID=A0AAD3CQY5_9STRA|nr:predicted protein [Chaetoceros tenuissimus]
MGRVLIDKPDSTDKCPISILHAYNSYVDTIVATLLSNTVEKLQVYDDTIAVYRPGYSCADCMLNDLLAVHDTLGREEILLCQLDEDKEKFFDGITPELQMLPFHLMGFPSNGYIDWIAESLHDLTILTKTPYGTVTTSFTYASSQYCRTSITATPPPANSCKRTHAIIQPSLSFPGTIAS